MINYGKLTVPLGLERQKREGTFTSTTTGSEQKARRLHPVEVSGLAATGAYNAFSWLPYQLMEPEVVGKRGWLLPSK